MNSARLTSTGCQMLSGLSSMVALRNVAVRVSLAVMERVTALKLPSLNLKLATRPFCVPSSERFMVSRMASAERSRFHTRTSSMRPLNWRSPFLLLPMKRAAEAVLSIGVSFLPSRSVVGCSTPLM